MTTVATSRKPRKPARETHGTCQLIPACPLPLPQALDAGEALLTILPERGRVTNYTVKRLTDPDGDTVGYRLLKLTDYIVDRVAYDIDMTAGYGWQCDCPDAQFQGRECKHVRALRAALRQAGIDAAAPQRQQAAPQCNDFDDP